MSIFTQIKTYAETAVGTTQATYQKISPTLNLTYNAVIEAGKAGKDFCFGVYYTSQSIMAAVKTTYKIAEATGNFSKAAVYELPRAVINQFYYKDEEATKLALNTATADMQLAGQACVEAATATTEMAAYAWDATVHTAHSLSHTKDAIWYAGEATKNAVHVGIELGALAYEGARGIAQRLPEVKSPTLYLPSFNNYCQSEKPKSVVAIELQSILRAAAPVA